MREMKHRKPLDPSSYLCFNYFSPLKLLSYLMRQMTSSGPSVVGRGPAELQLERVTRWCRRSADRHCPLTC